MILPYELHSLTSCDVRERWWVYLSTHTVTQAFILTEKVDSLCSCRAVTPKGEDKSIFSVSLKNEGPSHLWTLNGNLIPSLPPFLLPSLPSLSFSFLGSEYGTQELQSPDASIILTEIVS